MRKISIALILSMLCIIFFANFAVSAEDALPNLTFDNESDLSVWRKSNNDATIEIAEVNDDDHSGSVMKITSPKANQMTIPCTADDEVVQIEYDIKLEDVDSSRSNLLIKLGDYSTSNSTDEMYFLAMGRYLTGMGVKLGDWAGAGGGFSNATGKPQEETGKFSMSKWYHITAKLDMLTHEVVVTVESEDGTYKGTSKDMLKAAAADGKVDGSWERFSYKPGTGGNLIDKKKIHTIKLSTDAANTVWIDNFKITGSDSEQAIPAVDNSKIKLYADDIEQTDLENVSAMTKKIAIDFGVMMDIDSLESAVVLHDDTANVNVSADIEQSGRGSTVYNLNLPGGLIGSHTYTLTIGTGALNVASDPIAKEFSLKFKTKDGVAKLSLSNITSNGNPVTKLVDLTAGNTLNADVVYENTTGQEKKIRVLFCYYNGAEMKDIEFKTITVTGSEMIGTKPITHTIKNLTDIDKVSVIVWDDFASLISMPGCVGFK